MADEFSKVDFRFPVSLLPVRLEARFAAKALRVRIYPDLIHANAHSLKLTEFEAQAGYAYWTALWADKGENTEQITLERERLGALLGARRALYVAGETEPLNWEKWDGGEPTFPEIETIEALPPVSADLLPDFWTWRLYNTSKVEIMRGRCKNDVATDLCMAPTFGEAESRIEAESSHDDEIAAFLKAQNLRWMVDFKAAVAAGMAFEIRLGDMVPRFGALLVAGVRINDDHGAAAEQLNDQFRAHWFSHGLDALPTGTVTNNTDDGTTDQTTALPDMDAVFEQNEERRPLLAAGRAALVRQSPPALLKMPAADTLSVSLGMNFGNILDRTPNADRLDGLGGAVFNTVTGTGLGQFYADAMATEWGGNAPIGGAYRAAARHHFDWVRASGPVPSLRVGAQPYGVLPIQARLNQETAAKEDVPIVSAILSLLHPFLASLPVATLDPEATDGIPDDSPEQAVIGLLEVLGAVPNPHALHLRTLTHNAAGDAARVVGALDAIEAIFSDPNTQKGMGWEVHLGGFRARITGVPNAHEPNAKAPLLAHQRAEVEALKSWILAGWITPLLQGDVIDIIEQDIDPLLDAYEEAWDAMPDILRRHFFRGGISDAPPAVDKPVGLMNFVHSTYDLEAQPVPTTVTADGTLEQLDSLLELALNELQSPGPVADRDSLLDAPAPLLHWLIDQAWMRVLPADAQELSAALALLQARIADPSGADKDDPDLTGLIAELDRLMRESLSLFMNRLDAWVTSFASKRLANLRADQPRGITIGGYGWLLDLKKTMEPVSQGFIHTHSMNHAATAAVLRSGWAGYGTSQATAPLSVDLTSDRMRGAMWILDAVRGGEDLAEVLGARFERMLHEDDLPLDRYIDDVRAIVNAGRGLPRPEAQIADGVAIARAFSTDLTPEEQTIRNDLLSLASPFTGGSAAALRNRRVRALYHQLAAELDAVADVTLAQSVHALAQGKDTQSGAMLNMLGDQEGAVPEIDLPYMPRQAQTITHRIAAICPGGTEAKRVDPLSVAEPGLWDWLAERLPAPEDVELPVRVPMANGRLRRIGTVRASELDITSVEMMALCGRGESQAGSPLGRLMRVRALAKYAARIADPGVVDLQFTANLRQRISVDQFGIVAGAARAALSRMRALTVVDLTPPGEVPTATLDGGALETRLATLTDRLVALKAQLEFAGSDPSLMLPIAARLAAIRVTGAAALGEAPEDAEVYQGVIEALAGRIDALRAAGDTDETLLAGGIGKVLTILPPIDLARDHPIFDAQDNGQVVRDVDTEGTLWFRQIRRTAEGADALGDFLDLVHALTPQASEQSGVLQLPVHDERWAAVATPKADTRDRMCLYIASGFKDVAKSRPLAGIVAATWVDAIPRADQQTGLAVHFDSPSARPPQAILLSMLDKPEKMATDDQVYDQLIGTLELTRLRAIGADRIAQLGHIAPATFLPGTVQLAEDKR